MGANHLFPQLSQSCGPIEAMSKSRVSKANFPFRSQSGCGSMTAQYGTGSTGLAVRLELKGEFSSGMMTAS
jgi:hypothetical protein